MSANLLTAIGLIAVSSSEPVTVRIVEGLPEEYSEQVVS
jgi:hypothetical protein